MLVQDGVIDKSIINIISKIYYFINYYFLFFVNT